MDKAGLLPPFDRVNQPKVAIIGASGYIGKHLVAKLRRYGGYKIRLLVKSLDQYLKTIEPFEGVEAFEGDLRDPKSLQNFLEHDCIVINLVYLWEAGEAGNLEVTANLIEACRTARIRRLVHCSTAAVVGRVTDDLINEDILCCPVTEYGITKLKIEQAIVSGASGCFETVILRPTSVFGPGGNPLKKLASDLVEGKRVRNYLKSCLFGKRRMNLVSVVNVVASIIFLMEHHQTFMGDVFIVSDDDDDSNNFLDVEHFLMKKLGIADYRLPMLSLPLGLIAFLLTVLGRNNVNPRCNFSPNKLLDLGFERPIQFNQALAEYALWYSSTHCLSVDELP